MTKEQRVAIVTGGSRGIGRAIVEALAEEGLRVVVNYRTRADEAQRLVERLNAQGGDTCAVQADVGVHADIGKLVDAAIARYGRIDVLVNNAGVHVPGVRLADMRVSDWDYIIGVNLSAPFRLIQAVLPHMRKNKGGHIINLSSNVTQRLPASFGAYTVSKVGIDALTRILAKEEGVNGIRVNAIAPGPINTDMMAESLQVMGPQRAQALIASVPLGRMGEPSEIAAVARFLVSPGASYLTGQTIYVNGGGPGG
jgi:NAD(P)-dependent dehydrogenase (short-subunit alcohol dehydrogenase family)